MPQVLPFGMCKVVPPRGWSPQPWSGCPPKGFTATSPVAGAAAGAIPGAGATTAAGLGQIIKALSPSADGGEPLLAPRVQPVQLLNKGFLQCDGDIARLTVDEYHELCVAAWPGGEDLSVSEAEQQFWNLMVTEPGTGDAQIAGLKAARLRLEARYYQRQKLQKV